MSETAEPGGVETVVRPLVVAIDGPSGSGKSSTARGVAERLGLAYLDTGAMYRACAWCAARDGATDPEQLTALVREARLEISVDPRQARVVIDGTDVTSAIREPEVSAGVSRVSTVPGVRTELVRRQQELIGASTGMVVEGRDITTVVAPEAQVRVLLVADAEARIARRHAELGERVGVAQVTDQVVRRDADDATVAAFTEAADGVLVLDSTHLSLEQVVEQIVNLAQGAVVAQQMTVDQELGVDQQGEQS